MPVWRQLAGILRRRITSGRYARGQVMPSETQIYQEWGLAKGTIRKAIALLRDEGLIITVHGKGSFVDHDAYPELGEDEGAQPD